MLQTHFFFGLPGLMLIAKIIAALAVLAWALRRYPADLSRWGAIKLGLAWGALLTVEYWILGPSSYAMLEDEGEVTIPYLTYLTHWALDGQFAHGLGGGLDRYAMMGTNNAIVSLEYLLFSILPAWGAVAVHKIGVVGIGFSGAYLLARRGAGAGRAAAAALACWFTIAHEYSLAATVTHGFGYAIIPLAIYVFVFRLDKSSYFPGAIGVGTLHAISCSVTHSVFATFPAVFVVWAALGARRAKRFLPAATAVLALTVGNWFGVMVALVQNAPFSYRGQETIQGADEPILELAGRFFTATPEGGVLLAVSLAALLLTRRGLFLRALAICGVLLLLGVALVSVPWRLTPLPFLAGVDFNYIAFGLPAAVVLIAGWATGLPPASRWERQGVIAALALALAFGAATSWKVFNAAQWLGRGGQSQYWVFDNLRHPDWAPKHPFRTVTIPYGLFPNTVAGYGLETFDSLLNVVPAQRGRFFQYGLPDGHTSSVHNYIVSARSVDFLCCAEYDFLGERDLVLLRMANVEFVLSVLPLKGAGLKLVSGPPAGTLPPRRDDPLMKKIAGFLSMLWQRRNVYVYRIADVLPRAFVARGAATVTETDVRSRTYYDALANQANRHLIAPTGGSNAPNGATAAYGTGVVRAVAAVPGGYDLSVTMDAAGTVVVNTPFLPFWKARAADGTQLRTAEVNAIHTAIAVPEGTHIIHFRYARPPLF